MIAAGNIQIGIAFTGAITIPGLPFTPRRIFFKTTLAGGTPPMSSCLGLWSADRPDSTPHPQQANLETWVTGGESTSNAHTGSVAYINDFGAPGSMVLLCTSCTDNTIQLSVYSNTLANLAYVTWCATP